MNKIPIIAVCGPTASGKTSLSVELAKKLGAEIVSCDSMQIYLNMNIGTAKPTQEEMQGIPHYMIDFCRPEVNFSVNEYVETAEKVIEDIHKRGKRVILCGGTGLYLDTLLRGNTKSPNVPGNIRAELEGLGNEELWELLCKVDAESACNTHINNRKRVIRALEIYRGTGKTKSYWDSISREAESKYFCTMLGLDYKDREILYRRINSRCDIMFETGLVDEVKSLNLNPDSTAGQAIGYKEVLDFINGKIDLEGAKEIVKKATRRYAKRQLTWFRKEKDIHWLYPDADGDILNSALKIIKDNEKRMQ
ncbi:MAG: tRNA (adenosine(37)-N6)-dimethylallyltransferase MiaA [Clostridia bacterium]|nr:tRNA (adenosine(37)-N6)-dimethylallyltransferase MiaA [Clostridia bacterium]